MRNREIDQCSSHQVEALQQLLVAARGSGTQGRIEQGHSLIQRRKRCVGSMIWKNPCRSGSAECPSPGMASGLPLVPGLDHHQIAGLLILRSKNSMAALSPDRERLIMEGFGSLAQPRRLEVLEDPICQFCPEN